MNWCMYGSSGHNEKPVVGGVIENYVYRAALPNGKGNACIKTIVMPERVIKFNHPHYPIYKEGFFGVDFSGKIVPEWYNFIEDYVGFRINHYFTKSKAEWLKRRGQGTADGSATRTLDEFYEHDNNEVEDRSALFYLDRLKGVLKNR